MPGRVDHHPPAVRRGLLGRPHRPQGESGRFGSVEVVDSQIQMDLLWPTRLPRPVRRPVVRDPHGRNPHAVGSHSHEIVTAEGHLTTQELGPESAQSRRILAVEGDRTQSNFGHERMVTAVLMTRRPQPDPEATRPGGPPKPTIVGGPQSWFTSPSADFEQIDHEHQGVVGRDTGTR